jgi:diguanylate cyclase (GGDEF)-like protein/PAS domain S-box-containing protein
MNLAGRLSLVLCSVAALSTSIALIPQELAIPRDLEEAASNRLERSAAAAEQLLLTHLRATEERYESVSLTPEFRANLDTAHAPTLQYFANQLVREHAASLIAFVDRRGHVSARSGSLVLSPTILSQLTKDAPENGGSSLVEFEGAAFASVVVPLYTDERVVGRLVALEPIEASTLTSWSQLCGAQVSFPGGDSDPHAELTRLVATPGSLMLQVGANLDAERAALENARRNLLSGGAAALVLAFAASLLLARGLVRPIRAIQEATKPFGRGEFDVRLETDRVDEIGDVSRAINQMADRLEISQSRLVNAQKLARLGHWSLDKDTLELQASEQALRIYGLSEDHGGIDSSQLAARVHPNDRERFTTALERCIEDSVPFYIDHRTTDATGRQCFAHTQGRATGSLDGTQRIEGTVQDITDRKQIEDQVRYLADYDSLTGLANRRLFREQLDRAIAEARRTKTRLAVLFLDLDGFKLVNDNFGHSVGDEVLRVASDRLIHATGGVRARERESRAPAAALARSGGDEFILLLADIDGPESAGRMARTILNALELPLELEAHSVALGASIGIATHPEDGEDSETLLRNCDTAMYHAKGMGRNGYQFYSESMNTAVFKRLMLENKLRQAIEEEQLTLHFQPKISLANLRVAGFEALVRWHDAELGNVSPADFIPMAEEAGLIGAIGNWVLRSAVRQLKEWQQSELRGLPVAVNLSGRELSESIVERVEDVLREEEVDAQLLGLEITETAVIRGDASATQALEQLRAMGVRIALDDFGTGYSSLSYLRNLPIDVVKIDQSFVRFVETEPDDAALLGAIVSMAKVLNLEVVVEGVENEGQLALLSEIGCDEVQGFLLAAPTAPEDLPRVTAEIDERRHQKLAPHRETQVPGRGASS